ncbi:ubiquinol-cytochrome c reductase iron-sulfur subunit [Herbidospora daliensis]|uniref:QcrA and Rieske domain-containing protein n=1 Tax=Herbidospora daliensis TaxID=295585 RepID=UPI001E63F7AB|nr:Rieske (2Fe-2S) protein [Herbidospora daliensis]
MTEDQRGLADAGDASRRAVLLGVGGAGLITVVAACGGHAGHTTVAATPAGPSAGAKPGDVLAKTSDIPVEGGTVFPDQKVVVVQPAKGEFRAFSAVCTHQGCTIADVSSGMINCPCHGSMFWLDGKVMGGPATKPLPEVKIKVDGDTITLA